MCSIVAAEELAQFTAATPADAAAAATSQH